MITTALPAAVKSDGRRRASNYEALTHAQFRDFIEGDPDGERVGSIVVVDGRGTKFQILPCGRSVVVEYNGNKRTVRLVEFSYRTTDGESLKGTTYLGLPGAEEASFSLMFYPAPEKDLGPKGQTSAQITRSAEIPIDGIKNILGMSAAK